jgi:hypothetical protein
MQRAIKYFSYWDVPRTFVFERDGQLFLLTSEFDDALDEYPDDYEVFVVAGNRRLSSVARLEIRGTACKDDLRQGSGRGGAFLWIEPKVR